VKGFEVWRRVPPPVRAEAMRRAGDILVRRKEEIARAMTREMGKVLTETRGDVQEGIDTAYYAGGEGRRLFGHTVPSELRDKWAMTTRRPIGVAGIITPFNFPMAIPTWKIFPALLCGNAVVFKPANDVPHTGTLLVEVLLEAGVHPEAIQLVHGRGSAVGNALLEHPRVPILSFTGSTETGARLGEVCGRLHKRLSLEMGGKNAMIVMDDANLDLAIEGCLWGGFGTTGQRCTAASRVIVHEQIYRQFLDQLVGRARALRVGDGLDARIQMGPSVSEGQLETVKQYVAVGQQEGARLVCGGHALTGDAYRGGYFHEPTIFADVAPRMRIAQEEIFGPVVSVIPCRSLDEAIAIGNDVPYGLSASIYTQDINAAFRAMRDLYTGIFYVNAPTIGAEVHLPFGGTKNTGNGHREAGTAALDVFSEWKSVYVDFSGRLQRAQIDTAEL
jgi:aldehyde dehydrogenase (NAD+)